jgi:hypothetical protein
MAINVISSYQIAQEFKKSKYFRQNLGLVSTIDKGGRRIMNTADAFAAFYNTQYKTTIYAQGNVGDIRFYVDHYIKDNSMAIYIGDNFEEFLYQFDSDYASKKNIDSYLGFLLKDVDEKYEEKIKNNELKKLEPKPLGNPESILKNPGAVTYEDLKAYLEKKNAERYKNNNF